MTTFKKQRTVPVTLTYEDRHTGWKQYLVTPSGGEVIN